jgi:hypothetical protein
MRTFTFTLLAVLSYVAMIGATPLGGRDDPVPTLYVPLTSALASGVSDPIQNISPAHYPALAIRPRSARRSAL